MPGRRSGPNAGENLSSFISSSHCLRANSKLEPSSRHVNLSHVSGAESSKFSKGQKPSQRPQQMDSTRGQFKCEARGCLNLSTLIGVKILNKCGCEVIVELGIGFWVSESGTFGNGATNLVDVMEGVCGDKS